MPPITVPKLQQVFPVRKPLSHWLERYTSCNQPFCSQPTGFHLQGNHPLLSAEMVQPCDRVLSTPNNPDSPDSPDNSDNSDYSNDSQTIVSLIQAAQQKLRDPHIPHQLKMTAYIKLCCLAIQKSFIAEQMVPPANLYHNYMQRLNRYETAWWKQCQIVDGKITSKNPDIQDLLALLDSVVKVFEEA